ncbi:MAG: tetratricopeptide repeat protein [Bacteroidales bacterium]|nr:tetratricopeptide repeat protein [Bacteroidales bacterium]
MLYKNIFIIIFSLLLINNISAEYQKDINSLLKELENSEDTSRINILNELAWSYRNNDTHKAFEYSKQALTLAEDIKYSKGISLAYTNLGVISIFKGEYNQAIEYFNKSAEIYEGENQEQNIAYQYGNIGITYFRMAEYQKAIDYYFKALEINKKFNNKNSEASLYIKIGAVYSKIGNYPDAFKYHFKSLRILEKTNDKNGIAQCYNNIAINYKYQGNTKQALEFYLKALQVFQELDNIRGEAECLNNIGVLHESIKEYNKSIQYYQKALDIFKQLGYKNGISTCLGNLSQIYSINKNYKNAIKYNKEALIINNEINDKSGIVHCMNNYASIYEQLGEHDSVIEYSHKGFELAKKINSDISIKNSCLYLSKAYYNKNNFKEAYTYYKIYSDTKDSIFNKDKSEIIEDIKARYELEKKENEINQLLYNKKIDDYKRFVLVGLIVILIVFSLLIFLWQRNIINKKKKLALAEKSLKEAILKNTQLEKQNLEAEIEYKNKEIINFALNISQKNDFLENMKNDIKKISNEISNKADKDILNNILIKINLPQSIDNDRKEFENHVEQVNKAFFHKLNNNFPSLTKNEKRLIALLRLNLSSKEIANVFNISPSSVDMYRHRLRKKLKLSSEDNLIDFINNI